MKKKVVNLSSVDLGIVLLYFVAVIALGLYSKRNKSKQNNTKTDFLLAGRHLTLPLFVATLVATWYGLILGVGEFVYAQGIVAWVCLALPYYIAATIFALFVAGKIRRSNAVSIPEQVALRYGKGAGSIASLLVLIITVPSAYILMLGVLLQVITGLELHLCIIIGTFMSVAYLFTGGFKADVLTNALQFILMYIGFGALFVFSVFKFGGLPTMMSSLPQSHVSMSGGNSWQIILAWFIISLQTFIDPSFHQRSAAAISPSVAKKGILISVLFWILFDFLTITTGLYAKVNLVVEPLMAFPALGEAVLPGVWKGIFAVSMLATIMSTLNSYSFLSGITIGNDIISKIFRSDKPTEYYTRIGLALSSIIGITMAIFLPSAVQLIYKTASIAVPGLLIPLLSSYSGRTVLSQDKAMWLMCASSLVSGLWMLLSSLNLLPHTMQIWLSSVEPMIPGIVFSIVLYGIFAVQYRVQTIKCQ